MEAVDKGILVIGGGMTGMTAALEAADAGYQVYSCRKGTAARRMGQQVSQGVHGKAAL